MCRSKIILLTICFLLQFQHSFFFNVDTVFPVIYQDPNPSSDSEKNSYFGYSVQRLFTKDENGGIGFLVSAPSSNSTYEVLQEISQPGTVYHCTFGKLPEDDCKPLLLGTPKTNETVYYDNNGTKVRSMYTDNLDDSWFGGTLEATDGEKGKILVCGHRWKNEPWWYPHTSLMNGACYLSSYNASRTFIEDVEFDEKLIPLGYRRSQANNMVVANRYSYGQAGASAHFTGGENNEILIGAPGIHDYSGSVIRYVDCISNCKPASGSTQQVNKGTFSIYEPHLEPLSTRFLKTEDYFGYAVNSGRFFRGKNIVYVSSAPRANTMGSVFVFIFQNNGLLDIIQRLDGDTSGEYFGASLAVADFNNDGFDDLLVGSPFYRDMKTSRSLLDQGKVSVFISNEYKLRSAPYSLSGTKKTVGRFGSAITVIGDLNFDGFPDVAIGAPYENDNVGAVYIYHGSKDGVSTKAAQRIDGEAFSPLVQVKGFGISISAGDVDGNEFSDLLIGSYLSGNAVLLRSSPVVKFGLWLTATPSLITEPNLGSTFTVEACVDYKAKKDPDSLCAGIDLSFDVSYTWPRIVLRLPNGTAFNRQYSYTEVLTKTEKKCQNFRFVVTDDRDLSKSILMRLKTQIYSWDNLDPSNPVCTPVVKKKSGSGGMTIPNSGSGSDVIGERYCPTCPVMDTVSANFKELEVPFASGCGDDRICQADLKLNVSLPDVDLNKGLVIGPESMLNITVYVWNENEPAYDPKLYVQWDGQATKHRLPINCEDLVDANVVKRDVNSSAQVSKIVCNLANPLKEGNAPVNVSIVLDLAKIPSGTEALNLGFRVESASDEPQEAFRDNNATVTLPLITEVNLTTQGSEGEKHNFNRKKEIGIPFHQSFFVYQKAESPVELVRVEMNLPVSILYNNEVIQLVDLISAQAKIRDRKFECEGPFLVQLPEENPGLEEEEEFQRRRRSADNRGIEEQKSEKASILSSSDTNKTSSSTLTLRCAEDGTNCATITCKVGPVLKDEELSLNFEGRFNVQILDHVTSKRIVVKVIASAKASVLKPDNAVIIGGRPNEVSKTIEFTDVTPDEVQEAGAGIIAAAVVGGLVLFGLVVVGLYLLGFFKRRRPPLYSAVIQEELSEDYEGEGGGGRGGGGGGGGREGGGGF